MPDKGDSMKKSILMVIVTIFALAGVSEVEAACCPARVVRTCKPRCERKLCVAKAKPCKKACVRPPSKCGCNAVKAEAVMMEEGVNDDVAGVDLESEAMTRYERAGLARSAGRTVSRPVTTSTRAAGSVARGTVATAGSVARAPLVPFRGNRAAAQQRQASPRTGMMHQTYGGRSAVQDDAMGSIE